MQKLISYFSLVLFTFSIQIAIYAQPAVDFTALPNYLQEQIEAEKIPGAVSLIMHKGKIVQSQTFGYTDYEAKEEMQMDQIFGIASMTKPIISVALMMLYEEGHFKLDDPIEKYLPVFVDQMVATDLTKGKDSPSVPAEGKITIKQLLTHSAGLSHGLGISKLDQDYGKTMYRNPYESVTDRVSAMAALPLMFQPGEKWYYSASPDVLSVLIEKFSGQTTEDFLQERIFGPLGMENTGYNLAEEKMEKVAKLHRVSRKEGISLSARQNKPQGVTVFSGTHGLYSTAEDYLKFCQMVLGKGSFEGKQYLKAETIKLMATDYMGEKYPYPGQGFGLGFSIVMDPEVSKDKGRVGQLSWSGINGTFFFIDPAADLIAILMTQTTPFNRPLGRKMRNLIYGDLSEE